MADTAPKTFYRSASDRWIAGVCGGLARFWGIDPLLVRVLWIVGSILTVVGGIVAYILIWALAKEQ